MNLLLIAARIATPTTAGPTMDMVRGEKLDGDGPVMMYQEAEDQLSELGVTDWKEKEKLLEAAVFSAMEKSMPGSSKKVPKSLHGQEILHEVDHLLYDPDFDLIGGTSSSGEVESVMDEAFISAQGGYVDDVPEGAVEASYSLLVGESQTVSEALDRISSAPIGSPEKKRVFRAVVHEMKKTFEPYGDRLVEDDADQRITSSCSPHAPWGTQMVVAFMLACIKRYDTLKDLMSPGYEDVYRRFILNLKNELAKAVKTAS